MPFWGSLVETGLSGESFSWGGGCPVSAQSGFSREVLALFSLERNDASPDRTSLIYSKGGRNLKTFKGDRGWTLEDDELVLDVDVEQVLAGVADK